MHAFIKLLDKFNGGVEVGCKYTGALLVAVMTVLVIIQVFFRYVLNDSFTWTEELARFMMVWTTFISAPVAYRLGSNVSLDIIYNRFTGRAHHFLTILLTIAAFCSLGLLFYLSLTLVGRGMKSTATSLPIKMAFIYVSLPIGLGLTMLVNLQVMLEAIVHFIKGDKALEEHHYELSGE